MASRTKQNPNNQLNTAPKPSKRDKRMKFVIYVMVIVMLGSVLSSGLAFIL